MSPPLGVVSPVQAPANGLQIMAGSLPKAESGLAYSAALTATGGTSPYKWKVAGGALPPGLMLGRDGHLSGMSWATGSFRFSAQVIDSDEQTATSLLEINMSVNETADHVILWSTGFEGGGASRWYFPAIAANGNEGGGEFDSGLADSTISAEHVHSGRWALKMTIRTPPESGTRMFRWRESHTYDDLYYSVWYYFPQRYSVRSYWNIFQWKSRMSARVNDPFFTLNVGNRKDGTMYLYLYDWQTRQGYRQSFRDVPVGEWFNVTAHYSCTGNDTGHVAIWQDHVQLFDLYHVQTRYPRGDCGWSVNNYSDGVRPSPTVLYIDDAEIYRKLAPS
jgi:hypothetical protein